MRYKAQRYDVLGIERYFVIPFERDIFEMVDPASPKIIDEVLCQASNWSNALKIATAMNALFQKDGKNDS